MHGAEKLENALSRQRKEEEEKGGVAVPESFTKYSRCPLCNSRKSPFPPHYHHYGGSSKIGEGLTMGAPVTKEPDEVLESEVFVKDTNYEEDLVVPEEGKYYDLYRLAELDNLSVQSIYNKLASSKRFSGRYAPLPRTDLDKGKSVTGIKDLRVKYSPSGSAPPTTVDQPKIVPFAWPDPSNSEVRRKLYGKTNYGRYDYLTGFEGKYGSIDNDWDSFSEHKGQIMMMPELLREMITSVKTLIQLTYEVLRNCILFVYVVLGISYSLIAALYNSGRTTKVVVLIIMILLVMCSQYLKRREPPWDRDYEEWRSFGGSQAASGSTADP